MPATVMSGTSDKTGRGAAKALDLDFPASARNSCAVQTSYGGRKAASSSIETSEIAGHANTKITEQYTIVQLKRQDELTRRIQGRRAKAAQRSKNLRLVNASREEDAAQRAGTPLRIFPTTEASAEPRHRLLGDREKFQSILALRPNVNAITLKKLIIPTNNPLAFFVISGGHERGDDLPIDRRLALDGHGVSLDDRRRRQYLGVGHAHGFDEIV